MYKAACKEGEQTERGAEWRYRALLKRHDLRVDEGEGLQTGGRKRVARREGSEHAVYIGTHSQPWYATKSLGFGDEVEVASWHLVTTVRSEVRVGGCGWSDKR